MSEPVPANRLDRNVPPARPLLLHAVDRLSLLPPWLLVTIAAAIAFGVALADYLAKAELGLVALFVFPVLLITWAVGFTWGSVTALICVTTDVMHRVAVDNDADRTAGAWCILILLLAAFVLVARLVAELHAMLATERMQARTDPLTGLLNRRAFHEVFAAEAERSRRYRRPLTIVYLDLDRFKHLNDTRGHEAGDRLLRDIAAALGACVRTNDVISRLGGDEFCVIAPETDTDAARRLAHRLDDAVIRAAVDLGADVTASIGVATFGCDEASRAPATTDAMLRFADSLMYAAKAERSERIRSGVWDGARADDDAA